MSDYEKIHELWLKSRSKNLEREVKRLTALRIEEMKRVKRKKVIELLEWIPTVLSVVALIISIISLL